MSGERELLTPEAIEEKIKYMTANLQLQRHTKSSLKFLSQIKAPFSVFENCETEKYATEFSSSLEPKIQKYAIRLLKHLRKIKYLEALAESDEEVEEPASKKLKIDDSIEEDDGYNFMTLGDHSKSTHQDDDDVYQPEKLIEQQKEQPSFSLLKSFAPDPKPRNVVSPGLKLNEEMIKPKREMQRVFAGTKKQEEGRQREYVYDAEQISKYNYTQLEGFVTGLPQHADRADGFFKRFVKRDFCGEEARKPQYYSWRQWYQELKKRKTDVLSYKYNAFEAKSAALKKAEEQKKTQLIDVLPRTVIPPPQRFVKPSGSTVRAQKKKRSPSPKPVTAGRGPSFKIGYIGPNATVIDAPASSKKKKSAPMMAKCKRMAAMMMRK